MAQSITPFLMFSGKADSALRFYVSLFPNSEVVTVEKYGVGDAGPEGTVKRAEIIVAGQRVLCIDSPVKHEFGFTPAVSLFVTCESEAEFETVLDQLVEGGATLMPAGNYGFSRRFAWVTDRYGVSWQLNLP